jgi:hypothetical protein
MFKCKTKPNIYVEGSKKIHLVKGKNQIKNEIQGNQETKL